MMVLTNHESIRGIVHHSILNIISTDRANYRLINALVYLSVYQLDIYYMSNRLNFVSDVFSYLRVLGDNVICKDNIKPILDVLWDEDPDINPEEILLLCL